MKVAEAVADLAARLADAGVPTPDVDAELLTRHVLGWSRTQLLVRAQQPLPPRAADLLRVLGARRVAREPLQLIVGTVGFRHLDLLVRPGVFIPRPETEVLAGEAVARAPAGAVVVEPCTGSGAVACAVASEVPDAQVVATDVSPRAVALAAANARRCNLDVDVRLGDLLAPVPAWLRGRVDVLVSNPPYLAAGELEGVEPEVVAWDPPEALVSGATGNEVAERIVEDAQVWLRAGGWLLLEVAEVRAAATLERCAQAGLVDATVVRDLTGRERIVAARRP